MIRVDKRFHWKAKMRVKRMGRCTANADSSKPVREDQPMPLLNRHNQLGPVAAVVVCLLASLPAGLPQCLQERRRLETVLRVLLLALALLFFLRLADFLS